MPAFDQPGPMTQYESYNAGILPTDVSFVAINWHANRAPLYARLPKLPSDAPDYLITSDDFRPRYVATTGAFGDTSGTTLTVADATVFDTGDVVRVDDEIMLVTDVPNTVAPTTVTVTRAYASSTAATHSSGAIAYLITNTRTGAEIDIDAMSRIAGTVRQWNQTIQHAYSIGGALEADGNFMGGEITPLQRDKMMAMQHVVDDFESACYYGRGVGLTARYSKPAMKGLDVLIVTNHVTAPTNAAAYKLNDLVRDTLAACYGNGGNPDLMIVSTDFMAGLTTWGLPITRIDAGATAFGTPIKLLQAPFLDDIYLVPSPLLRSGTAICLSTPEARIRVKRPMIDKPRGSRGDAVEGDIIMEGSIELVNEKHHAWVSGITNFSAT